MSVEVFEGEVVSVAERLLGTAPADLLDREDAPPSTLDEARSRSERIRAGLVLYVHTRAAIAEAWARRDWKVLGYDNWDAYLIGEFGDELRRLTGAERREAVQEYREAGMPIRAIAGAVQADKNTVMKDLSEIQTPQPKPEATTTAPETKPEKVKGADGKDYPTKRQPKPSVEDKPAQASDVAEKLDRFLGDDPALKVASWRKGFASAIHGSFQVAAFTPEQVAANADRKLLDEVLRLAHDINDYARRCEEAWNEANGGLRLVGGQK